MVSRLVKLFFSAELFVFLRCLLQHILKASTFHILLQIPVQRCNELILTDIVPEHFIQLTNEHAYNTESLIKGRIAQFLQRILTVFSFQDLLQSIILLIFPVEFQIIGKILGNLPVLNILVHHFTVNFSSQSFIRLYKFRKVFPASRRGKHPAIHRCLHPVKMIFSEFQIRQDRRMNLCLIGVFLPDLIVFFHVDLLNTVQCHHIKITHRLIILRRISCRYDDPALRHLLVTKGLTLQKLQHRRRQRL